MRKAHDLRGRGLTARYQTTEDNEASHAVATAVEKYLKPFLLGRDPEEIEDIWQSSYVSSYWRNGPVLFNAMSGIGLAHHNAGRHAEAARWTDKAVRAFPPAFFVGLPVAIVCYVAAGRLEDAKKIMAECLRRRPGWSRSTQVAPGWVRSPELRAKFREACIQAGLPE